MPPPDKNTSVFLDGALPYVGDLSHAETRRGGEFFSRKERKDHKVGGPTSVSATIDRSTWKRVRLGDVLQVCHGKCQHSIESNTGKYPILATSGEIGRTDSYLYDKPSVLIGRKGTIDKPQYIDSPFWTIDTLFYTKIAEGYNPKFLYYLCLTIDWTSMNEASGVPSLSANRIESLEVTIPGVDEQDKISNALSSIDKHVSTLDALIAKYEAIKKATVNLLKPKAGWNKIRLADFESHRNNTCSRSLTSSSKGNVHNIHYGNILVNFGEIVSMKYDHVDCLSEEGEACSPKDYLQDGDIVIADTAEDETAGKVIEVQDVEGQKAVAGLHTVFLRPPSNLFARGWLGYWMNSRFYHDQLLPYMTGIKVLSLSKSSIANTEICYPAMEKQKHIVGILKSIDTHIATLQAQACKARQLKDGMMSYFFG